MSEVKTLLVELILEQKIQGKIDQVNGFLELEAAEKNRVGTRKQQAIQKWANTLLSLHNSLTERVR